LSDDEESLKAIPTTTKPIIPIKKNSSSAINSSAKKKLRSESPVRVT
jgi:hypothetical protein